MVSKAGHRIQIELGENTMIIIWTAIFVTFIGSTLLISLSKRGEITNQWERRFQWLTDIVVLLPLFNFYHFCNLASRVVRIK